jgi:hypothetical protein
VHGWSRLRTVGAVALFGGLVVVADLALSLFGG